MNVEELIVEKEVCDKDAEDPLELLDRHAIDVTDLNNLRDNMGIEGQCTITIQDKCVDNLKDDVFHAGEVKTFDCKFDSVLDSDSDRELINVVVLDSQDQVESKFIRGFSVLLKQMDQVIQNYLGYEFNVLDYQYYWLILLIFFEAADKFIYSKERLIAYGLISF